LPFSVYGLLCRIQETAPPPNPLLEKRRGLCRWFLVWRPANLYFLGGDVSPQRLFVDMQSTVFNGFARTETFIICLSERYIETG